MAIEYLKVDRLDPDIFIDVLLRSDLSKRRPVNDKGPVSRMLLGSNLMISAQDEETARVVGVARSNTGSSWRAHHDTDRSGNERLIRSIH